MAVRAQAAPALALLVVLLLPAVQAHTTVYSADGRVRASVGLLGEPVSTYAVTGLDLCFTQNQTTAPRTPVAVTNAGNFTARLKAPSGAVHEAILEVPFGRAHCLTFADPLVLTEPGHYLVDLDGSLNGTTVSARGVKAGGAVLDRATLTFPAAGLDSDQRLQERIAALETQVARLEDRDGNGAPGAPAALLMLGLAAVAAVLRRGA